MNPIQLAILGILQAQAVGSSNAMNSDDIFNRLSTINVTVIQGRTQEQIRAEIRSMIKDHNQLIGSKSGYGNANGYFMINARAELIDTINNLTQRSNSILERAESLKMSWNAQNPSDIIV